MNAWAAERTDDGSWLYKGRSGFAVGVTTIHSVVCPVQTEGEKGE